MIAPIPLWIAIINILILPISTALAEDGLYLGCGVNQIKNKYIQCCFFIFISSIQLPKQPYLSIVPYCYNRMYRTLTHSKCLCGLANRCIIVNNIACNSYCTLLNIIFQRKTPKNRFYIVCKGFRGYACFSSNSPSAPAAHIPRDRPPTHCHPDSLYACPHR